MATSSRKIMGRAVIACLGLLSTTGAIAQNDTQQRTSTPSADAGVERERADRQAPQPVLGPQSATVVPSADAQVAAVAPAGVQNLTNLSYS